MSDSDERNDRDVFATTDWTGLIEATRSGNPVEAEKALASFCQRYRPAIYQFIRRRGISHEDAEDLVQSFFATKLLQPWSEARSFLQKARRESGHKFRAFLSHALICFLKDQWRRRTSLKAEGSATFIPLEALDMEKPSATQTARSQVEVEFDRVYARALIDLACGQDARSQHFVSILRGEKTHTEVGEQLGLSSGAVKVAYHRFARRLGASIRAEVERTVGPDPEEAAEEIRYLMTLTQG